MHFLPVNKKSGLTLADWQADQIIQSAHSPVREGLKIGMDRDSHWADQDIDESIVPICLTSPEMRACWAVGLGARERLSYTRGVCAWAVL